MIKEGKFGPSEAIWLTVVVISSKAFFSSPSSLAKLVGTASWYTTLISGTVALIGFTFIYLLVKRFPEKDLVEIYNLSLGKVTGFIFSLIVAFYMLFVSQTRLSEFYQVMRVYVFPLSPNWYLSGLFVIAIYIVCILGLESMARFTRLIMYIFLAGLLILLVLGYHNYNINNLYPILGYGIDKTVVAGVMRSSVYGEVIILAIFARSLHGPKYIKKEGYLSIILSMLVISVILLVYSLTFPYYRAIEITAPVYEIASLIHVGRFLARVESIFLIIWILSTLISVTVIFYAFIWVYCKMFNIEDKKPIVLAGCIILYSLSIMQQSIIAVFDYNVRYLRLFGSIPAFILPFIALIVAVIRKKGEKQNGKLQAKE